MEDVKEKKTIFESVAGLIMMLSLMNMMTKENPEDSIKKIADILKDHFIEKPKEGK